MITNRRSILILEKGSASGVAGAVGGAVGAAVANLAATRKSWDYGSESLDNFAANPKNIVIPHDSLALMQLKKGTFGQVYRMNVEYKGPDNRTKKIKGFLNPPGEHMKQKKQEGVEKKEVFHDYAKQVDNIYRQALSLPQYQSVVRSEF